MARLLTAVVAALLLGSAVAGCAGQSSSSDAKPAFTGVKQDVAQVVDDLESAARKQDGKKICKDILAPSLVAAAAAGKRSCKSVLDDDLTDADTYGLDVKAVTVTGNTATATVRTESAKGKPAQTTTFTFAKDPGANGVWKITSFG